MLSKSEVKYIQTLSQKKLRAKENLFLVEGPKILEEAIASKRIVVRKVFALEEWINTHRAIIENLDVVTILDWELEKISQLKTPNQVLALVQLPDQSNFVFNVNRTALVLDGIQDPGNLGTIIRIADWFGIKQIICSEDCADAFSSKVVQATMGSIFRVELYYTNLALWCQNQNSLIFYGATLDGVSIKETKKIDKGVIVIGNESKGIRENILPFINKKITIEKFGEAESLNAAVATGIILSHLL